MQKASQESVLLLEERMSHFTPKNDYNDLYLSVQDKVSYYNHEMQQKFVTNVQQSADRNQKDLQHLIHNYEEFVKDMKVQIKEIRMNIQDQKIWCLHD